MEIRNAMDKDDTGSSVIYEGNGAELVDKNSSSKHIILVRPGKPPSSNVYDKQPLFLQKTRALESSKIPKYVVSFDEKIYLLRCLERIHVSTFKSTPGCNSSGNIGIISTGISSRTLPLNIPRLAVECLLNDVKNRIALKDMVDAAASGDSILGTISSSKSMVNILSSPLLYQLGALSSAANVDSKSPVTSDVRSSPVKFVEFSPKNMKEMVKRHVYANASRTSSSSSSDKSSYSNVSGVISQGMLKCTWKHGLPSFVLSLDDLGEIYVANLHKIQSPDDKSMDYVYNFYSKPCGKRENEVQEFELDFVGMVKVSNSVILCPNNSETLETRFVLFGSGDYGEEDEPETLVHNAPTKKTIKGLRNKVANAIRTGHGPKKRIPSKHSSTRNVHESMAPNLELAAIIVKTHVENAPSKKQEIGGWGLKFLKKPVNKQTDECCCECSTSMNILVPRGYHGGPRARNDGGSCLSSIIDRWSLGGHCDCGGWDVGCPLTVLSTKPTMQENVPPLNDSADCKAEVDLFVKGSKQNSPIMKMTNIQEDLHNIHFHSSILSPLQCLSIATAIIHNRTNSLRPKLHT